jgi:hypothetical protein
MTQKNVTGGKLNSTITSVTTYVQGGSSTLSAPASGYARITPTNGAGGLLNFCSGTYSASIDPGEYHQLTFPTTTSTILATNGAGSGVTIVGKTITDLSNYVCCSSVYDGVNFVSFNASAQPGGAGYTLITTDSNTATWQAESALIAGYNPYADCMLNLPQNITWNPVSSSWTFVNARMMFPGTATITPTTFYIQMIRIVTGTVDARIYDITNAAQLCIISGITPPTSYTTYTTSSFSGVSAGFARWGVQIRSTSGAPAITLGSYGCMFD